MNDQETVTLKTVLADYEKDNPTSTSTSSRCHSTSVTQKFTTASQAGKGPDVMRAEIADVANWALKGFLADLTIKVSAADKARLPAGRVRLLQLRGQGLGLFRRRPTP